MHQSSEHAARNMACVDRAAAAQVHARNQSAVWKDIQEHWHQEEQLVQELATKHNKHVKWMRLQVNRSAQYGQSRKINKYNAWLHVKSLTINEGELSLLFST
jgi:hypothetical protein